ncbi:MAG: metal-dependent hydrolase [Parvibaculum sp.]
MTDTVRPSHRMELRRVPFSYEATKSAHWNAKRPEFSQMVNAASLAMPYLEPYLIRTMRKARPLITCPALQKELDLYVAQEATHFRQHQKFNDELAAMGYAALAPFEALLAEDYKTLEEERSLKFNLAYAEGFESMALALGEMLIDDRDFLFGGSDPHVASLILWHFVEEIEHKNVAFDVFDHLYGSYAWRIIGLVYATGHIFFRTGQGYRALLKEDGLWKNVKSRWRLAKMLARIFARLTPKMARILAPGYHPAKIKDPDWGVAWAALYHDAPERVAALDTNRLNDPLPA